jgi:hypothetical protein
MKALKASQIHLYWVDQAKTDKRGAFPCPCCGSFVSPSDHSERVYSILEVKMNARGLEEIRIRCNRCGSQINLTGFSLDFELHEINGDSVYIAHI